MKIIFTDIDGVLVTQRGFQAYKDKHGEVLSGKHAPSDEVAVENYNKILKETGAKIVIASVWRYGETLESLQAIFDSWGVRGEIIGMTPILPLKIKELYPKAERGIEIGIWLICHPEVTKYVIIDDDTDMLEKQKDFLVKTDFEKGIDIFHRDFAIKILNQSFSNPYQYEDFHFLNLFAQIDLKKGEESDEKSTIV